MTLPVIPETPAALYDLLHEKFGIGVYDDLAAPQPPWFKARMTEINKLKAQMKARRVTVRQVAIAAWYAEQHGARIRWVSDLFKLIPAATAAYNKAIDDQEAQQRRERVAFAIDQAIQAGEYDWAERFFRADPRSAAALLDEWEARHD